MIYRASPTAQGQWVSAYDNRKEFIYEGPAAGKEVDIDREEDPDIGEDR